jgi:predicted N-acetyltransferase YhbS
MSFEEDDTVVLHDQHSEYDGDAGTITQVMESMFGDATYTISFEDGQEAGVPEDSLELVEDDADDEDEEAAEDDA